MKIVKMLSLVAVLGLISASQVKAFPGEHNLTSPNLVSGHGFSHMTQPAAAIVPEPSNWAVLPVLGVVGVIAWRRMSRKATV